MKCAQCKFFTAHWERQWGGSCGIVLPAWLPTEMTVQGRFVRGDDGCDLGQPKPEPVQS